MHRIASVLAAAAILLAAGPVLAMPHGKPGLWTITTTMQMANMPQMPPQVLEMMKKRGMPGMGQPVTSQMCMTQEQVNAGMASHMQQHDVICTPRVLSETSSSAVTEITCHGDNMEGVGRSQINWRGDGHYEGSYEFKGSMHGQPNQISTHYVGDFVKGDCGGVKPFTPPPQH